MVALLGLEKNRNLYVDLKGNWLSEYIPITLRCYPFALIDHDNQEGEKTICIDQDCFTDDSDASPLYKNDGEKDESFIEAINLLTRCEQDRATTQEASNALFDCGVIEAWPFNVRIGEDVTQIEGIYRINEAKLNSLEPLKFAGLRESGAFSIAYAQLFSMTQLSLLIRRYQFLALQKHQLDSNEEISSSILDDESLQIDK